MTDTLQIILFAAIILLLSAWIANIGVNEPPAPRDPAEYSWRVGEPVLNEYWIDKQ